jgi:hypothetical protein
MKKCQNKPPPTFALFSTARFIPSKGGAKRNGPAKLPSAFSASR